MAVVSEFCDMSEQTTSLNKSQIYISDNCSLQKKHAIQRMTMIPLMTDLGFYLGIYILHRRVGNDMFQFIIDKV